MAETRNTTSLDLIGDIHAQQRKKLFRRVALIVALIVVLLLIGLALKYLADRRDRDACLDDARESFTLGTSAELSTSAGELEVCIDEHPGDSLLLGALALTRAQLAAEFGEFEAEASEAVAAVEAEAQASHDGELARVMLDLDQGNLSEARERLGAVEGMDDEHSIAPNHEVWVGGMLAIADPEADLDAAIDEVAETVERDPSISIRRLLAGLYMHAGDGSAALEELGEAREQSRAHLGLAADEALYNALLRQKLPGVADVADQLLSGDFEIATRDRAHALLARGVVRVQSGEIEEGMKAVDDAWDVLPGWDKLSRALALEMAMEAGDAERARKWIDEAGLRAPESDIYEAWVELVEGDVMRALEDLSKLPQEHPRVALLQGLSLVEQNRWDEAKPWLDRADKLLPGRIDVEVARARVEVHTGDPEAARRKLEALAEEEPYAPRAWTGLGEAHLAVAYYETKPGKGDKLERVERETPDASALKEARRAFKWAVQRERMPAEAYLQLAEITDRKRRDDPNLVPEVIELLGKAVAANPKLPRYAEREALYLAEVGLGKRAREKLEALAERPGISWRVPWTLAELSLDEVERDRREALPETFDAWLAKAEELHAPKPELELLRARALLLREKPEEAKTKLEALLKANESNLLAHVYYIRALMDLRDRDAALVAVRSGRSAIDNDEAGLIYFEWGTIMARGGKRRAAATHARNGWNRLREQEDVPADVLIWAADEAVRALWRDGKPKPAVTVGKQLTDLVPYHSDAWVIRSHSEQRSNRGSDAKASAEKAVELDDKNPRAHEILGHLYLRFGRKDDAKASYEKALKLGKGSPQEDDYKKNIEGLK